MRTREEILEVVHHPASFLKSDLYKSAFIEIYSFLPLEDLPEAFTKRLSEEAKADWNKDTHADDKSLEEDIKEEIKFLKSMLKEDVIIPAMDRTPRLLALLWIKGNDVSTLDNRLMKIRLRHNSLKDLKTKLTGLYIRIEKQYIF